MIKTDKYNSEYFTEDIDSYNIEDFRVSEDLTTISEVIESLGKITDKVIIEVINSQGITDKYKYNYIIYTFDRLDNFTYNNGFITRHIDKFYRFETYCNSIEEVISKCNNQLYNLTLGIYTKTGINNNLFINNYIDKTVILQCDIK